MRMTELGRCLRDCEIILVSSPIATRHLDEGLFLIARGKHHNLSHVDSATSGIVPPLIPRIVRTSPEMVSVYLGYIWTMFQLLMLIRLYYI